MQEAKQAVVIPDQIQWAVRVLVGVIKMPKFNGRHIPIYKAAAVMGKNQQAVREGLKRKILPIGDAIPTGKDKKGRDTYTYYISPKLFWEYTGVLLDGQEEGETDEQLED